MSTIQAHLPWGLCPSVSQDGYQWFASRSHLNGAMRMTWRVKTWRVNLHNLRANFGLGDVTIGGDGTYFTMGSLSDDSETNPFVAGFADEDDILCNWRLTSRFAEFTDGFMDINIGTAGEAADASGVLESRFELYQVDSVSGAHPLLIFTNPDLDGDHSPPLAEYQATSMRLRLIHGTEDDYTETVLYEQAVNYFPGSPIYTPFTNDTGYISVTASAFHAWDKAGPAIYSASGGQLRSPYRVGYDGRVPAYIASASIV